MKRKVLILGSTGLIGHQVYNYLKNNSNYELHNLSYRKKLNNTTILVDARDEKKFINIIKDIKPNIIINCIGILIKGADKDPENAIYLNAYLPHRLVSIASEINSKLIHISTDCVFSGDKNKPYIESDYKDGQGVYPRTKALGEVVDEFNLTIRTSVVGPEIKTDGEELFHWFMSQKKGINGYRKAIWSGVSTIELAKFVMWSIEQNINGLYHCTNNMSISKYELLELFKKHTKKNIDIVAIDGKSTNKSFVDTRLLIDYEIPSYDQMVSEMVVMMNNNKQLYNQYF